MVPNAAALRLPFGGAEVGLVEDVERLEPELAGWSARRREREDFEATMSSW